jgi:beta-galactosidase beta subunit
MRDLFFMNAITENLSLLFLNEWAFVLFRPHDGRSPTMNVGTQSPHQGAG